jgi:hypothetical protein
MPASLCRRGFTRLPDASSLHAQTRPAGGVSKFLKLIPSVSKCQVALFALCRLDEIGIGF